MDIAVKAAKYKRQLETQAAIAGSKVSSKAGVSRESIVNVERLLSFALIHTKSGPLATVYISRALAIVRESLGFPEGDL